MSNRQINTLENRKRVCYKYNITDFPRHNFLLEGRLEQSDFNGQSIVGKMEIRLEKPALNNFRAYRWQK